MESIIEQTWEELGASVRPIGHTVFVRTDPIPEKTRGGIILAPSTTNFYEGPFHLRLATATVLSVGPRVRGEPYPGDRVCFQRKYFARWKILDDRTYVGWLQAAQITGIVDPDSDLGRYVEFPEGDRAVREHPL